MLNKDFQKLDKLTVCTEFCNLNILQIKYLLNECNTSFEIHAEVNELPDDAFLLVLLLLEDEHVMVEELLQTLVGVVDAKLLERVVLQTTHTANSCSRPAISINLGFIRLNTATVI